MIVSKKKKVTDQYWVRSLNVGTNYERERQKLLDAISKAHTSGITSKEKLLVELLAALEERHTRNSTFVEAHTSTVIMELRNIAEIKAMMEVQSGKSYQVVRNDLLVAITGAEMMGLVETQNSLKDILRDWELNHYLGGLSILDNDN